MDVLKITGPINYTKAGEYLRNLPEIDNLNNQKKYFVGGTFSIDIIWFWLNQNKFSGLMFWFGLENPGIDQKYFIGLEPKFDFTYKSEDINNYKPEAYNILVPGNRFSFSLPQNRDFIKFLKNDKQEAHLLDGFVDSSKMEEYRQNFLQDEVYGSVQKSGLAYFIDRVELQDQEISMIYKFIKQEKVKYIRYYIGYNEKDLDYELRLILIPVDQMGKNIVLNKNAVEDSTTLLQYSWPPNPTGQ